MEFVAPLGLFFVMPTQKTDSQYIQEWRYAPERFANECMRFPQRAWFLTTQQKEALGELSKLVIAKTRRANGLPMTPEQKEYAEKIGISIMSGKGTGKDFIMALVIFWFLTCFLEPRVLCTANTREQLRDVLWSQLSKMMRGDPTKENATPVIDGLFELQADKLFLKEHKGKEHFAIGRTVNIKASTDEQALSMMGHHAENMMICIDEASGINSKVYETIESTLTQSVNFVFMVFNPTRRTGLAIDTQYGKTKDRWIRLHWNAEDSEMVTKESVAFKADEYGVESDYYRVNVLGLPPIIESDAFIPYDWFEDAIDREVVVSDSDPVIMGVDVARYGKDKTVMLARRGNKVLEPIHRYSSLDGREVADKIRSAIYEFGANYTFVDTIGIGASAWDFVKTDADRLNIYPFEASWSADDKNKFDRLGDETCWRVRGKFQNKTISVPNDEELRAEATSRKYDPDHGRGKIKMEPKKDMRKRGLKSPNTFDALAMTYRYPDDYYKLSYEDEDEDYHQPRQSAGNASTGY